VGIEESDELLLLLEPEPREALERWMTTNQRFLSYADWQASGNTSAGLLGAYVKEGEAPTRGVVIKVLPPRDEVPRESTSHRKALNDSREYAAAHLLEIMYDPIPLSNNGWITFQEVAGGGFEELTTLGELIREKPEGIDRLAARCEAITRSVLSDWATPRNPVKVPVHEFLRGLLGNRVDEGGTLTAWAARHPGLMENPRPWLAFGDLELANPFALALDPGLSKGAVVPKIVGKAHGDLHPDNILVPRTSDAAPDAYWLVDLSRYRDDAVVAWDPAYLATTITAMLVPSFSSYERRELTSLLINPARHAAEEKLSGLHACLTAINGAAMNFTARHGLKTAWRDQAPLCLLACSLVLSGRSIILPRYREWFFWLAAHAATAFVRKVRLGDPTDPLRLPDVLIDPIVTGDPDPDPRAGGVDATPRRDQDLGEAVILQFPADLTSGGDAGIAAPEQSTSTTRTAWEDLVYELQRVVFEPTNWLTLAASTELLRIELARERPPHVSSDQEISRLLKVLEQTLTEGLRPLATQIQVRSACDTAERLRSWLLDLLV